MRTIPIDHNPVKKKLSKKCPWWLWRHRMQSQRDKLDGLLLASTPEERVKIQKTRFYETWKLRDEIEQL